ncbi:MAG: putative DNA-binding domain-containing protein [Gammaproteobacteria bacterium]|nr:putative DNA-binding domain-containing protein [Gammaproteobacteria bacterium]
MSTAKFQQAQIEFARYLRDPDRVQAPAGIEQRRLDVYRELIFNNIKGFIESGFPVLNTIVDETEWHELIYQFVRDHRAKSPYFAEVAQEFLLFLESTDLSLKSRYPFIVELAHYEWVELALLIKPLDWREVRSGDSLDLLATPLCVSPVAWPLAYEYPVHAISDQYQPTEPPDAPTLLVVYRNREEAVKFLEVNPLTFQLLSVLSDAPEPLTGQQAIAQLQSLVPQIAEEVLQTNGLQLLLNLFKRNILLPA